MKQPIFLIAGILACATPIVRAEDAATPPSSSVIAANPHLDRVLLDHLHKNRWDNALQVLAAGANANASEKNGTTALMLAAQSGKPDLVRALLEHGADVNATNNNGQSALHLATQIGAPKPKKSGLGGIAKALGGTILNAGMGGFGGVASMLGSGGIGSMLGGNLQGLLGGGPFNLLGRNGWTAILGTAMQGDINSKGAFGLEGLLSSSGAALDASGWVSLMSAARSSEPRVLGAMAQLGGADAAQSAQWSRFLNAAASGDRATVETLMNDPQMAPLLAQAMQGFKVASGELPVNAAQNIVSQLVEKGADFKIADKSGKTAAQLAQMRGWNDVAAQLNAKNSEQPELRW